MPAHPAEQRIEKTADVAGLLRADLEELLVRDFVVEVHRPVAVARHALPAEDVGGRHRDRADGHISHVRARADRARDHLGAPRQS